MWGQITVSDLLLCDFLNYKSYLEVDKYKEIIEALIIYECFA